MKTQTALPADHPMMLAWNKFAATDEFKNALHWAVETRYDDGRPIDDIAREQHAKGSLWLAFIKGMESGGRDEQREHELRRELLLNAAIVFYWRGVENGIDDWSYLQAVVEAKKMISAVDKVIKG